MISSFDLVTVTSDRITVDQIIWRRYRNRARGMVEIFLDLNPHLAKVHRFSPFLPVGTQVRVPIDYDVLRGAPKVNEAIVLWGKTPEGQMTQGT
jgi:phage tail protein X